MVSSNIMAKKVIVGLSGGVDSSVAAYLLKKQGYDVQAVYMVNWHNTQGVIEGSCPDEDDILIAKLVARKLNIPFLTVDFSKSYKKRIVDYMFSEYEKGRTPNPDVLCNREIKFDIFYDKAAQLGADFVATGHYCRKDRIRKNGKTQYRLLAGKDPNKDQSYFLCQLNQKQLEKALFPIGNIEKSEVRKIAAELDLASAHKKDSQGICFVGKVDLPTFLQQKLQAKTGNIILIPQTHPAFEQKDNETEMHRCAEAYRFKPEEGKIAGKHRGAHFYTVGQRRGLGVGGLKEPAFVIATDTVKNIVYIGEGKKHPGLYRKMLFMKDESISFIRPDLKPAKGESVKLQARIRYRQKLQNAELIRDTELWYLVFEQKQRGITAGQFAAFYQADELIGSGVIEE